MYPRGQRDRVAEAVHSTLNEYCQHGNRRQCRKGNTKFLQRDTSPKGSACDSNRLSALSAQKRQRAAALQDASRHTSRRNSDRSWSAAALCRFLSNLAESPPVLGAPKESTMTQSRVLAISFALVSCTRRETDGAQFFLQRFEGGRRKRL